MAIRAQYSDQEPLGGGVYNPRLYPFDQLSKVRLQRFSFTNDATVGDIGTTINLCRIPQGRVRVPPWKSYIWCNAWGAARTLDFGFRAYYGSDGKTAIAEAGTQMKAAKDVSAALAASQIDTADHIDFFSLGSVDDKQKGPMFFTTLAGDTETSGRTLSGYLAYLYL